MSTPDPTLDLNQTIVSDVNARIEAEMMKALSGDDTIGRFVTAALRQTVEVPDPQRTYNKIRVPFLTHTLQEAIRAATVSAVQRLVAEELPTIEEEVRKALRRDVKRIAETLTKSVADAAAKAYGVHVDLSLVMPNA